MMTNEATATAPAPVATDANGNRKLTAAEMRAQLEADRLEAQRKIDEKFAKQVKALAEAESREAIQAKMLEITQARRDFYRELIESLDVTIPETGLIFDQVITVNATSDGEITVSIADREVKQPKTGGTGGTRAARGTGTSGKLLNAKTVEGFDGFVLQDGTETKTYADVCAALDIDPKGSSANAVLVSWAIKPENADAANEVMVKVGNDLEPLHDLVAKAFGKPAETPAAEAPAEVGSAPAPVA